MHDRLDGGGLITALFQHGNEPRQVGDRIEVLRTLLPAVAPVEVAANAHVKRGAGELANVIDVFEDDARSRLAAYAGGRATALPGFWDPEDLPV